MSETDVAASERADPTGVELSRSSGVVPHCGLAVVRLCGGGDGVAYVGRLLERALAERTPPGSPVVLEAGAGIAGEIGPWARLRFLFRLGANQVVEPPYWWMFNHLGPARAQLKVPSPVRRPYAVFLHGIEAWDSGLTESRKEVLRRASLRVANSAFTAGRVAAIHPDIGPIHPCPLGLLPLDERGEVPDEALLSRVAPRSVLIVGRMSASERYKGHDQLIECWPRVLAAVSDAQLVIAGRGDDVERLRSRARETGLGESVLFPGFVSEATLQALLRRAALFAMPSRGEGFGLVYLEAMRAGLPCIGSTADAAVDVIVDGETGRLVNPEDHTALADALANLLEDADRRAAMGAAGRRRFEEEFTYERFRDRLLPLLQEAFGSAQAGRH